MKTVLLITTEKYPNGDAGAVRTHTLAKIFQFIGYESTVVGMGPTTNFQINQEDDVFYISFRSAQNTIALKIKDRLQFHKRLKRILADEKNKWDVIIVSLVSGNVMETLKRYAKKNGSLLLHDSVEWYSPEQFSIGKFHPTYISMDRRNRKYVDKSVRVIAISSYLENHFKSRGILTTRIPVVMDMSKVPFEKKTQRDKIVFTYAGAPRKKDYLNVIVKGFALVSDVNDQHSYELRIIGITEEQLISMCDQQDVEKIKEHLICYGRISREQVLEHLLETDFTVLMRSEEQRYAKAGFPTKFVESLATATPVIANSTSDLKMYLKDGENGYIVPNESPEALEQVLLKVMNTSYEQRCQMQLMARKSAEISFDYRQYVDSMDTLLKIKHI